MEKTRNDPLLRPLENGIELKVIVLPRSSRSAIVGVQDSGLKIKISKPPVDGQANAACCRQIADLFGLPASRVTVVRGHTGRRKIIRCEGLSPEHALEALKPWAEKQAQAPVPAEPAEHFSPCS